MRGPHAGEPTDWKRLESLYQTAAELPASERAAFLDAACTHDAALRRRLDELLAVADDAEHFFARFGTVVHAAALDSASPTDALVGTTVGRYRIDARLGAGGMGVVYRAYDTQLQRDVALKLISAHLASDDSARKRFLTEARAAAALDHPNICTIHETSETDSGVPYIAMAYCSGETLKRRISGGPVGISDAVKIAAQIARGLAVAHARGIIHRDVKPGNIMIGDDGLVKLVDFGLARLTDVSVTAPGIARGTFAYIAPELLRGKPATAQTDLWSLGVVLYEMLAGARPFRADTDAALLYSIAHERPEPITNLQRDVPDQLADIVDRLLHDNPNARYQNARDVASDLEQLVGVMSPSGSRPVVSASRRVIGPSRRRWLLRWPLAAGGATGLALLVLVALNAPPATSATTTPRVVVLFFTDETPARDADALVNTLTRQLNAALGSVPGLNVPPLYAVVPFRDRAPSIAADSLDAQYLIGGFIERSGERVVVIAQVSDRRDRLLETKRIEGVASDEQALVDDVILAVTTMVRERIGRDLQLRRWQEGTRSGRARSRMVQAEQEADDAADLSERTQPRAAVTALFRADSALAGAAAADPRWAEPLIERAWVARQMAATMYGTGVPIDSVSLTIRRGLQYADAALPLRADSARVHEVRGDLLHTASRLLPSIAPADSVIRWTNEAEREVLLALERNNSLARALNVLSSIQFTRGDFEQARITTVRAYQADYFLQSAEILHRLFSTNFETGVDAEAKRWCTLVGRRYAGTEPAIQCRLLLMLWSEVEPANADTAWQLVERAKTTVEPAVRRQAIPQLEILAAGVAGRTISVDSASRALASIRARVAADTILSRNENTRLALLLREAGVRARLGQRDIAIEMLREYLLHRPTARTRMMNSRVYGPLFSDPRL